MRMSTIKSIFASNQMRAKVFLAIMVLTMATALLSTPVCANRASERLGSYGYGYGYGEGYGFDGGSFAGYRTGGGNLDQYALWLWLWLYTSWCNL